MFDVHRLFKWNHTKTDHIYSSCPNRLVELNSIKLLSFQIYKKKDPKVPLRLAEQIGILKLASEPKNH